MKHRAQLSAPSSQQPDRVADIPRRALDAFSDVLTVGELAEWRGITTKHAHALISEGAFDFALVRPSVGRILLSRARLREWADGELHGLTVVQKKRA